MSELRKKHLIIDGAQPKGEEHADTYKPVSETDQEFRTSKSSLGKSKPADPAEEKLLKKEDELRITPMATEAKYDHRNGDTKIELDAAKKQFTGLTKDELLKYADDPFWVRLRWFMFLLFWALWLCMLAGAIAIILRAPKCAKPAPKTWYEEGPLLDYSDVADYTALESKLDSLKTDRVQGVFINPCENTYDVLEDDSSCMKKFKEFLDRVREKGIKFIVDLTANYVPTTHEWFVKSENKSGYDGYFTWGVGQDFDTDGNRNRPNNWVSTLNEPAWKLSDKRQEYYLHQFKEDQADLNFHKPAVVTEFDNVLKKWVEAGAAGVRLRHARQLLVSKDLKPDPLSPAPGAAAVQQYGFYRHNYTSDQPELQNLFQHWAHLTRGEQEKVFTIHEDGLLKPDWHRYRNASALRPPSAAPLRYTGDVTQLARQLVDATSNWTALQIKSEDPSISEALAAFSILLPAAPVLTEDQLPKRSNDTEESESFRHLSELRHEQSIKYGETHIVTVPDNNSTALLLAVARWKEGQPGYIAVLNPESGAAHANLTGAHAHFPPQVSVHHMTSEVRNATSYKKDAMVDADNVIVPPKSYIVLSYVVNKEE